MTTVEIKKALSGVAFFSLVVFREKAQWEAECDGRKLVVNRKSALKPGQPGLYAFKAHATIGATTFVNLTNGVAGVATEEPLPELLEVRFRQSNRSVIGTARVHGATIAVVPEGDIVPNDWCTTWLVRPVSTCETSNGPGIIGEVTAEVISADAAKRRAVKGRVVKHPVIVRGTEPAAIAAQESATA